MLYYFDINTCIVTTVSGVSNTITHDISKNSAVQLLLFFCCKKKQKLQCSGLTSKQSNSFNIVFIVWRQFFLFCFVLFLRDKFWCFYHFLWTFQLKNKCTFHENIYTNEKLKSFSNKICNFYVKKEKKKVIFNWLQEVNFLCSKYAIMCKITPPLHFCEGVKA